MTEKELADLEAKVLGGGGGGSGPPPAAAPTAAPPADLGALEQKVLSDPNDPLNSGANAAGYAFIDTVSGGILPWMRDKIADLTGNTTQARREDQRAAHEELHPIAQGAGKAAGIAAQAVPALAGLRGVSALNAAEGATALGQGIASAGRGALAMGGTNVADQVSRGVVDDKPFDPVESAIAAGAGALGTPWNAVKAATTVAHPVAAAGMFGMRELMRKLGMLEPELAMLRQTLPQEAARKVALPSLVNPALGTEDARDARRRSRSQSRGPE